MCRQARSCGGSRTVPALGGYGSVTSVSANRHRSPIAGADCRDSYGFRPRETHRPCLVRPWCSGCRLWPLPSYQLRRGIALYRRRTRSFQLATGVALCHYECDLFDECTLDPLQTGPRTCLTATNLATGKMFVSAPAPAAVRRRGVTGRLAQYRPRTLVSVVPSAHHRPPFRPCARRCGHIRRNFPEPGPSPLRAPKVVYTTILGQMHCGAGVTPPLTSSSATAASHSRSMNGRSTPTSPSLPSQSTS